MAARSKLVARSWLDPMAAARAPSPKAWPWWPAPCRDAACCAARRARSMARAISQSRIANISATGALVDCPGSIEFSAETENALMAADIAVVVLEPVIDRLMTVAPILRFLDRQDIPHLLF